MKTILFVLSFIVIAGCSKRDILFFKDHIYNKNGCTAIAVNAGKQNTRDFFVIRTFDQFGKLTHLKTQLKDLDDNPFIYDYNITYTNSKAILKGTTKEITWAYDIPDGYSEDPPSHFVSSRIIDTRDIEILFDQKTRYATEIRYAGIQRPLLKVSYNKRGFLNHVQSFFYGDDNFIVDYTVATDNHGNILSIKNAAQADSHVGQEGISYQYGTKGLGTYQYYETPNIFIHPMYSILELLNWGPFQPKLERTSMEIQWALPPEEINMNVYLSANYTDHKYDTHGNLISYTFDGDFGRPFYGGYRGQRTRTILWTCPDVK